MIKENNKMKFPIRISFQNDWKSHSSFLEGLKNLYVFGLIYGTDRFLLSEMDKIYDFDVHFWFLNFGIHIYIGGE